MQAMIFLLVLVGIMAVNDTGKVSQYQNWNQQGSSVATLMLDAAAKAHTWCKNTPGCGTVLGKSFVPYGQGSALNWFSTPSGTTTDVGSSYVGKASGGVVKGFATRPSGVPGSLVYVGIWWQNPKDTESTQSQYGSVLAALMSKAPDGRYVGTWQQVNGDPVGCFVSAGAVGNKAAQTVCFGSAVPALSTGANNPMNGATKIFGVPMILMPVY